MKRVFILLSIILLSTLLSCEKEDDGLIENFLKYDNKEESLTHGYIVDYSTTDPEEPFFYIVLVTSDVVIEVDEFFNVPVPVSGIGSLISIVVENKSLETTEPYSVSTYGTLAWDVDVAIESDTGLSWEGIISVEFDESNPIFSISGITDTGKTFQLEYSKEIEISNF